jgi:WD40 repeat protein/serine/threonine protein kinase/tetratricopeptide (TPR) repeat protein
MTPSNSDNLIGQLAEEWRERLRKGERPDLSEYTDRYPELADEIRDLFPAIGMMEELKPGTSDQSSASSGDGTAVAGKPLERLGDFRILREVGRGGMGVVYEAEQESLGRRVALKVLPSQALLDPDKRKRFQREAKATARLHHTNIVPVYGVGEHEGMYYYVMQFIQGLGLDEVLTELKHLRKYKGSNRPLPPTVSRPAQALGTKDLSAVEMARSLLAGQFATGAFRAEDAEEGKEPEPAKGSVVGTESVKPRLASASAVTPTALSGSASSTSEVYLPGQAGQATLSDSGRHYWLSVARIGVQVAEALEYANGQGIIHRDIKPSNLLLDTQGTVWVTDFGLAKAAAEAEDLTHSGDIVGTLRYMAPERFRGQADARGDIYSLGLTLYELLVQRPAFSEKDRSKLIHQVTHDEPTSPRRINPAVPRDLETIVLKAIDREPARRYQTAEAMAEDLRRFVEDKPIRARRVSMGERLWRWCRRNPALASATGLAVAALAAVTIVSIAWNISQSHASAELSQAFQNLSKEQERTQAEQKRTQEALERERLLAVNLAAQEKRTQDALTQTRHLSAKLLMQRGQALVERQSPALGMLWLVRGLEMAPAEAGELRRVARTNLAGLHSEFPTLRALLSHQYYTHPAVFSPDGKTLLTASLDRTARLWDSATGRPLGQPLKHENSIRAVAFSPNGKWVLTGGLDKTARLWDAATGQPVGQPLEHPDPVLAVAFSPDGQTLLTGCQDKSARLWEAQTGKPIGRPLETDGPVYQVTFSPDGKRALTKGYYSPGVKLWDDLTGKPVARPLGPANYVILAAFLPDGETVLTLGSDRTVRRWKAVTGQPLGKPFAVTDYSYSTAVSPDGKTLLIASNSGATQLWDVTTGKKVGQPMQHGQGVSGAAFSPDGRTILTWGNDRTVRLWDVDTGRPTGQPLPHPVAVTTAQFSPDGRTIFTAGPDNMARLWDLPTGRTARASLTHLDPVRVVAFSPDGKRMVTGGGSYSGRYRGEAQLWDPATGQLVGALPHNYMVTAALFSPDSQTVLTASQDGMARLWEAATGKPIGQPFQNLGYTFVVAFSPDSKTFVTGGWDRNVRLWEVKTGKMIGQPWLHLGSVTDAAFSPDGQTVVTASQDGMARLWDVRTGKVRGKPFQHERTVRTDVFSPDRRAIVRVAFSSDRKTIVTGCEDNTARLWDARTGKPLGPPLAHQTPVTWVAFSRDGTLLLTAGMKTVRLWETATGKPVGEPLQHPESLLAVALSPDGTAVLTGSRDRTARLWNARTGQALGPPLEHPAAVNAVAFSPDGKRLLTGCEDRTARLWAAPAPVRGEVRRLMCWVEVSSGMELAADGTVRLLDAPTWQERRKRLQKLGGPPDLATSAREDESGWHQRLAEKAVATGHWFAARWHLDWLIAARPEDWSAHALRGKVHLRLGQKEKAAADSDLALKLGPPEAVRDWFGRQSPDHDPEVSWQAALWYLDRLVRAQPKAGLAYALRTKAYLQLGQPQKAAADWAQAQALGPREEVLSRFRLYGNEAYTKEQWQMATWVLDRLAQAQPTDGYLLHWQRGWAHGQLGKYDQAARAYAQALAIAPSTQTLQQAHVLLRVSVGDEEGYRQACAAWLGRLQTSSDVATWNTVVWRCCLGPDAVADPAQALRLIEKAVAQSPNNYFYLNTLGAYLYRAGRYEDAVRRLNEAMKGRPGGGSAFDWVFLAMAHHRLGHAGEAGQWLAKVDRWISQADPKKTPEVIPGLPLTWLLMLEGRVLHYEAQALIRGSSDSKDPRDRVAFARAHSRLRQWDKAEADYTRALDLQPEDVPLRLERGRFYLRRGQWDKAAADLAWAQKRQPDEPQVLAGTAYFHRRRADSWANQGKAEEAKESRRQARKMYEKLLAVCPDDPETAAEFADFLLTGATPGTEFQDLVAQARLGGWTKLAVAHCSRREWPAARVALQKAATSSRGGDGYDHFLSALVHRNLGQVGPARKELEKAFAWMDKNPPEDLLRLLAAEVLNTFLGKTLRDTGLLTRRAHVLARLGKRVRAIADYQKVREREPKNPRWLLRLAQLQPAATAFWNFDFDMDGWRPSSLCRLTKTEDGLRVESASANSYLSAGVKGPAGWKELTIRVRLKAPIAARVLWGNAPPIGYPYSDIRSQWFALPASGKGWQTYKVYLRTEEPIDVLYLDIGATGNQLEIDSLTLREASGKGREDALVRQATQALDVGPDKHHVRFDRGDLFARLGRRDKAEADFAAARKLSLEKTLTRHRLFADQYERGQILPPALVHIEALLKADKGKPGEASLVAWRGRLYAGSAQWKRAAADFSQGFEREPPRDANVWFEYAYLRLQVEDAAGYRKLCGQMLERFGTRRAVDDIALLAHTCVLAPGALGDAARVIQLAEKRLALTPAPSIHHAWSMHIMGLACYRAGQHKKAIELLHKGVKEDPFWEPRVVNWLALAMAEQRLGHAGEARKWFAKAEQWISDKIRNQPGKGTRFAPTGWLWRDWLGVQRMRREAEALVNGKAPDPKK